MSAEDHSLDRYYLGKSADELLGQLSTGMNPGSLAHEVVLAALQVQIATMQRDAARDALKWAKVQSAAGVGATVIALVALLVAAL